MARPKCRSVLDCHEQATDFGDHEQAVAGKEAHVLAQRALTLARVSRR